MKHSLSHACVASAANFMEPENARDAAQTFDSAHRGNQTELFSFAHHLLVGISRLAGYTMISQSLLRLIQTRVN